jgi:hypothetical protein
MRRRTRLFIIAGLGLLIASGVVLFCSYEDMFGDELPPAWDLEEISQATPPYAVDGTAHVLAWKILEDDRPLRVESCLVLKALENDEGYSLVHLYRHPDGNEPKWGISQMHVTGEPGTNRFPGMWILHCKRFEQRPTNEEIYAALSYDGVGWQFEIESWWTRAKVRVCERNWQEATGEPPTQFFVYPRRNLRDYLSLKKWLGRG